jgi:hypothetical protein
MGFNSGLKGLKPFMNLGFHELYNVPVVNKITVSLLSFFPVKYDRGL